ncbi:hypothetical protein CVT26_002881 [Gymnopilus dilepis]|uniref:Uncharacterized protein n=1 Tax=Gymnopilus dilepis TaxID=231916 RepID=A0A409WR61_9AGAR|nr:hypothetical protein CVT26_002881 [Gymnopilus dilepis]
MLHRPEEAAKTAWTQAYAQIETTEGVDGLAEKLIALMTAEQIFSASSIAFLDWIDDKSRILSRPLSKVFNDNENHMIFLLTLLKHLPGVIPQERITAIVLEGVVLEKACTHGKKILAQDTV